MGKVIAALALVLAAGLFLLLAYYAAGSIWGYEDETRWWNAFPALGFVGLALGLAYTAIKVLQQPRR